VCTHQRYPASVAAELEDARQEYLAKRIRVVDDSPSMDLISVAREIADVSDPSSSEFGQLQEQLRHALVANEQPRYRGRASDWEQYVTASMQILVPGLESWQADMLPAESRLGLLYELGYFQRPEEAGSDGDGQNPPEQQVEEVTATSTGAEPQPSSPDSSA